MKRIAVLSLLLVALLLSSVSVLAQDPFEGMTPEELFPGAIDEQELSSAYAALMAAELPDARDRFEGQTLTVAVQQAGPRGGISGPYFFWRDVFEAATGATLEIVEIPQAQFPETSFTDFMTGQNSYDVLNIGAWYLADYVTNGWAQPVEPFFGQDGYPVWDPEQVAPPLAALLKWDGVWYGTLNDGDAQMLYYRRDILEDPEWQAAFEEEVGEPMPYPIKTWQDLLAITSFFNGKDWDGDGEPDDGISLHLRSGGQGMFHFMTLSAPFAITPADGDDPTVVTKYDNIYWFDPDDMTPLINQPGHVRALEFLQDLAATGSESQFSWDLGEAWNNFLGGNAVATFSWGDVGSLAQDPSVSIITGKLGGDRIPCSEVWYDRELGEFVEDAENPNCVGNTTGGSWYPIMSSYAKNPELAYYFMAMHANQSINFWNVTYGWTGIDPGALYTLFEDSGGSATVEDYVNSGYNADDVASYIKGYGDNLFTFPTTLTYLRIPGTVDYWNDLDIRLAQVMIGELQAQEAMDLVAEAWNETTSDLGLEDQLAIYQQGIGYTP